MKTYVICGALQGIGLETMIYFANKRCNIIACAHKSSPEFDSICNKLQIDNKITITKFFSDFNDVDSIKYIVNDI
jgi:NAD(P)-dependent dehydrogenase (short-subunit alcohol dehydrogenase family)